MEEINSLALKIRIHEDEINRLNKDEIIITHIDTYKFRCECPGATLMLLDIIEHKKTNLHKKYIKDEIKRLKMYAYRLYIEKNKKLDIIFFSNNRKWKN